MSPTTITSIPATTGNNTKTFTVRPNTGLAVGTYTAIITVENTANSISETFNVSFTVNAVGATDFTLNSVSQDGNSTKTTTQLTLTFSAAIPSLTATDITLSGVSGVPSNGTLSGSGPTYTLDISGFTVGGTLTVTVASTVGGKTIGGSPKTVIIYYATPVTFSGVTADGDTTTTTTQLTLTFSQAITGLVVGDITLSGVSGTITKSNLQNTGGVYTLDISGFTSGGTLTVAVAKAGYNISGSPQTTTIYYYAKSAGSGISNFNNTLFTSISLSGFTIDTATAPSLTTATGQTIEYGVSASSSTNPTTWTTDTTSLSLSEGTNYIFVRAKENTTHNAGTPSSKTLITTGMMHLFTQLGANCTYDGSTEIIMTTSNATDTVNLSNAVTIPSGVNMEIAKGILKITSTTAVFILNGTMNIKSGGGVVIEDLKASNSSFTVEDIFKTDNTDNTKTILTIESGGTLTFPAGSIYKNLENIAGKIVINAGGQMSLNRVEDSDGNSILPSSAYPYLFIGKTGSDFEINSGSFNIICNKTTDVPLFQISGKVTIKKNTYLPYYVPLNTDLTVPSGGELIIAEGAELSVFTEQSTYEAASHYTTLTIDSGGIIRLVGGTDYSKLTVTIEDVAAEKQYKATFTNNGSLYVGTSTTEFDASSSIGELDTTTDPDKKTWKYK